MDCEENEVRRSGRDCCIICQKVVEKRDDARERRRLVDIVREKRDRLIDGAQAVWRGEKYIGKPAEIFREDLRVNVKDRNEDIFIP